MPAELPTVVVDDDEDRILRANDAAARLLGVASTESLPKPFSVDDLQGVLRSLTPSG